MEDGGFLTGKHRYCFQRKRGQMLAGVGGGAKTRCPLQLPSSAEEGWHMGQGLSGRQRWWKGPWSLGTLLHPPPLFMLPVLGNSPAR